MGKPGSALPMADTALSAMGLMALPAHRSFVNSRMGDPTSFMAHELLSMALICEAITEP